MKVFTEFTRVITEADLPDEFPSPFTNTPHQVAKLASKQLQLFLKTQPDWRHDFTLRGGGKMFGVLVVRDQNNRLGFVSAFSGMLAGCWQLPGFAPPMFSEPERNNFLPKGEAEVAAFSNTIENLQRSDEYSLLKNRLAVLQQQYREGHKKLKDENRLNKKNRHQLRADSEREYEKKNIIIAEHEKILIKLSFESQQDKSELKIFNRFSNAQIEEAKQALVNYEAKIEKIKKARTLASRKLHRQVFSTYLLNNKCREQKLLSSFYEANRPPGGAGDCAAPKLLHYATSNGFTPIALAEFWWGAQPAGGVRHHGQYYPACRGKCRPILPFMLRGLNVQPAPRYGSEFHDVDAPYTIYEDENLVVVNKPEGLLSVPGKEVEDSVLTRMQARYPNATGPLLVHRLDLPTSGLLLVAKDLGTHKALQSQFIKRIIEKRYVAILSVKSEEGLAQAQGVIELPVRVDFDDRPRQVVCYEHGKKTLTRWEIVSQKPGEVRVYFYPHTGRTHQLRVHASHRDGLNAPILGDRLYGENADRLYLHAEWLKFIHPVTGEKMEVTAPVPF